MGGAAVQTDIETRAGRRAQRQQVGQDLYDFTRPDRIPQAQIRAIQLVHENAARSLSASLSAHLAAFVNVHPVSFVQTSYREFIQAMPSPSVIATVGLRPFDGFGLLDLPSELVFPVLEMLLGRRSRFGPPEEREVTDIELRLLEGVIRVILQDLREAWKAIGAMEFKLQSISKEPQFVQALAPGEAVLAVTIPVQIGEVEAVMHLAMPSLAIGRARPNTGPQWKTATSAATLEEQETTLALLGMADTVVEVALQPTSIRIADLLSLNQGDLLITDNPIHRGFHAAMNGRLTMLGDVVRVGRNLAFAVGEFTETAAAGQPERGAGENAPDNIT
jgi:flagellar motor switch protein FliM